MAICRRMFFIFSIVLAASLAHSLVPTSTHSLHLVHISLRKLYFVPPILAGMWFGLRGSIAVTALISVIFSIHAVFDWPGNSMEQANQGGELVGFWLVAVVSGLLFDRQKALTAAVVVAKNETLSALISALDLRERNTGLHSHRVRRYALMIADAMGVDDETKQVVGYGALLHDIGKIAVPDIILLKEGSLSDAEWLVMKRHPSEGSKILSEIGFLRESARVVSAHHERYDGSGYPEGLKGDEIPLGARIFAVADAYDALTSDRPYHKAVSHEEAVTVISAGAGRHFDGNVVLAFRRLPQTEIEAVRDDRAGMEQPVLESI